MLYQRVTETKRLFSIKPFHVGPGVAFDPHTVQTLVLSEWNAVQGGGKLFEPWHELIIPTVVTECVCPTCQEVIPVQEAGFGLGGDGRRGSKLLRYQELRTKDVLIKPDTLGWCPFFRMILWLVLLGRFVSCLMFVAPAGTKYSWNMTNPIQFANPQSLFCVVGSNGHFHLAMWR